MLVRTILLFFSFFVILSPVPAQNPYWQQEVNYTIDVSLNDKEHTLDGFVRLQYSNHSPDTLHYIWFHLWPNAFKNDRTAFSEQLLQNGRTDFYFSGKEQRGYINRLDFRMDNATLRVEDHPQHIDIVKVYLLNPLAPGQQTMITTPFHVKLPANFSRGGHTGQSYQITQWYPKPAVYDGKGWHPMPYVDQGEFYSEFGSFDVRITLPENYVVAATGELQDEKEKEWLRGRSEAGSRKSEVGSQKSEVGGKKGKAIVKKSTAFAKGRNQLPVVNPPSTVTAPTKTLRYIQNNIHDFAWFADKNFIVQQDTIQLAGGKIVHAYSFYKKADTGLWKNSIQYIKEAVHFRSNHIGDYPYNVVSVVATKMGFDGGMEYPTITSISPTHSAEVLDLVIEHEIGHNWFYGALASNERDHPWLDEGVNSYYDNLYEAGKYPPGNIQNGMTGRLPANVSNFGVDVLAKEKKDQPVATASEAFTPENYSLVAYAKAAAWLKQVEEYIGSAQFDLCMKAYYRQWQFKHPYPEDFQQSLEQQSGKELDSFFISLHQKGPVTTPAATTVIKPVFLFSFKEYQKYTYINWLPVPGYNQYDKLMLGLAVHNYNLPSNKFRFLLTPLYATGSKQLNGIGGISYSWNPDAHFRKIEIGVGGSRFSTMDGVDSNGAKIFGGFYKIVPSIRFTFSNPSARSTLEKWIEWKTYFIGEKGFTYFFISTDSMYYPATATVQNRYLNQLTFTITDYRALYPYDVQLQVQQGNGFYRATATGHYLYNYAKGGGLQVRMFAAKFGFIGERTLQKESYAAIYQPKLTAVRGNDDYTYSNYFLGRNEFDGFASQQIMMRDGGLKIRSDLFQYPPVRTENWLVSMNFNSTLPEKLFPFKIPLRLFLDIGTYAESWKKEANTSKFMYVGGLQLSLFKDLVHFYAPIIYSSEFRNNLLTVPEDNKFFKRLSFSIDIHRFNWRKVTGNNLLF